MAYIRFDSGPRAGEVIPLDKPKIVFGRQPTCDCVLKHPTVSREHFYIERNGGKYFVVDQGSGNGTFANGERISWLELRDGDKIQAGPFTMTVEMPRPSSLTMQVDERARRRDETGARILVSPQQARTLPREYLEGIDHFNAGRYFDAHEIWEEVWLRSSGDTKLFYQMLIQAAVGLHHYERGNHRGARGMYKNVVAKLACLPGTYLSLDLGNFSRQFKVFFADLIENENEAAAADSKQRPVICLIKDSSGDEAPQT